MRKLALALSLLPTLACAQTAVQQAGPVTNNKSVMWARDHQIRQGAGQAGDVAGKMITGGTGVVGQVCSFSNTTDQGGISLCLDGANGQLVYNGTAYPITGGIGNVSGPVSSTIDQIACWNNTSGTLIKDCGNITSRTFWTNTLSGDSGATLRGGVEITTDTSDATSLTDIGKINALYVVNKFGHVGGATNGLEGQRAGVFAKVQQDGPVDYTSISYQFVSGVWSWVTINQGNTDIAQPQNYTGVASLVELGGTDSNSFYMVGAEFDVNIGATNTVGNRIGVLAAIGAGTFGAPTRAVGFDGAFAIARGGSSDASWKMGYGLRGPNGVWPFADDSILIGGLGLNNGAGGVDAEAGNGLDFTGIAFLFQQYISDNFQIDQDGQIFIFNTAPQMKMRNTSCAVEDGCLMRWAAFSGGNWAFEINTAVGGDFSTSVIPMLINPAGGIAFGGAIGPKTLVVGDLPTCNSGTAQSIYAVTDAAATPVYNAVVSAGGAARVLAFCDGVNWRNH